MYKPLDKYINRWLKDDFSRLLIIMGEYGTGKTTFTQYVTHQLASQCIGLKYSQSIKNSIIMTIVDPLFQPVVQYVPYHTKMSREESFDLSCRRRSFDTIRNEQGSTRRLFFVPPSPAIRVVVDDGLVAFVVVYLQ